MRGLHSPVKLLLTLRKCTERGTIFFSFYEMFQLSFRPLDFRQHCIVFILNKLSYFINVGKLIYFIYIIKVAVLTLNVIRRLLNIREKRFCTHDLKNY